MDALAMTPGPDDNPPHAPGQASLKMVADEAGVSPSTVSRFLNGTAKVAEHKRVAIEAAIRKLHFVANPMASSLAGGKSRCIGVITQDLSSPFYGQALLGIEDVLTEAQFQPLFMSGHWREEDERRCIASLEGRRVDGLIILSACLPDEVLLEQAQRTPMVMTGRSLQGEGLVSLGFDDFEGARLATEHLIERGHRQIAFIRGTQNHPDATERYGGFRAALKAHGLEFDPRLVVQGHFLENGGYAATKALIKNGVPFSAIFAANDQMAFGAILALHEASLRVPEHVSVVGFDDLTASTYFVPPLTTVRHSMYEIGRLAAKAIIHAIRGEAAEVAVPLPELVVRASTAAVG